MTSFAPFSFSILCFLLLFFANQLHSQELLEETVEVKDSRNVTYSPVYIPGGANLREKGKRFDLSSNLFIKSATYSNASEVTPMNEGESYSQMDSNASFGYGYSDNLQLEAGLRFRQVQSKSNTADVNNSGLESYYGSVRYGALPHGDLLLAIEGKYRKASYTNQLYQHGQAPANDLVLGDDGQEITLGGHLSYKLSPTHFLYTFGAYNIPGSHLSSEVLYDVHSAWAYTRFAMLIGAKGIISMKSDPYSEAPESRPSMSTGSTANFNSLNREMLKAYIGFNWAFESFTLGLMADRTMYGRNQDEGMSGTVSIMWTSEGVDPSSRKIQAFKEYQVEASVIKVSPRGKFLKIDKGVTSDVEKNMRFDIYKSDFFGGNELLFSGVVMDIGADWAIIKIDKVFKEHNLEVGLTARGK